MELTDIQKQEKLRNLPFMTSNMRCQPFTFCFTRTLTLQHIKSLNLLLLLFHSDSLALNQRDDSFDKTNFNFRPKIHNQV